MDQALRDGRGIQLLMATKPYQTTSFVMNQRVLRMLKKTASSHNVAMSGLVNLAIKKLLDDKSPRQIEMLLKREDVKRRRSSE